MDVQIKKCAICSRDLTDGESIKGHCGHEFHYDCLEKRFIGYADPPNVNDQTFLNDNMKCPTCDIKWKFEGCCAICRGTVLSSFVTGICGHEFHLTCITKWLAVREVCPLDNRTWKFRKTSYSVEYSLKELCSRKIASDVNLVMECLESHHLIDDSSWDLINKSIDPASIKTPPWMTNTMRTIMAKMFHSYYPHKELKSAS